MTKHDNVSQEGIMKATEFVKEFGWDEAKGLIAKHEKCYMPDVFDMWSDELQDFVLCTKYASFDMSDLKRLVESHELVERTGGLRECRLMSYRMNVGDRLAQAIADVEACQ